MPNTPVSHAFVERLIGTVRRELLHQVPFWNAHDLERKLLEFEGYYNEVRPHSSLEYLTPHEFTAMTESTMSPNPTTGAAVLQ